MSHRIRILIVDDDYSINSLLQDAFQAEGWEAHGVEDGEGAIEYVNSNTPDMVILDIGLPKMNGIEVCKHISNQNSLPTIMLSAHSDVNDKIRCLNLGADDYITKPFNIGELIARVKAVLRRCQKERPVSGRNRFVNNELDLDFKSMSFKIRDNEITFTLTESLLLQELVLNEGKVLTVEYLLHKIWGSEYKSEREYLHVYINRLRAKIEVNPKCPNYLINEPGVGYVFRNESNKKSLVNCHLGEVVS